MKRRPRPLVPHPTDPSVALVELTKGHFATVSIVDAADVGQFTWSAIQPHGSSGAVYAVRSIGSSRRPGAKTEYLHRRIGDRMGLSADLEVDHRNTNGLDCRRSNLRSATGTQNRSNTRLRSDNASGIKGIYQRSDTRRWTGAVKTAGKRIRIGSFDTPEAAALAIASARTKAHGEFANHGRN